MAYMRHRCVQLAVQSLYENVGFVLFYITISTLRYAVINVNLFSKKNVFLFRFRIIILLIKTLENTVISRVSSYSHYYIYVIILLM